MSGLEQIAPIGFETRVASAMMPEIGQTVLQPSASGATSMASFANMLTNGVADMQARIDHANEMVRAYALDDSIPAHSVMIALEEARISIEMGLQIRNRLVDVYRDVMNMQL